MRALKISSVILALMILSSCSPSTMPYITISGFSEPTATQPTIAPVTTPLANISTTLKTTSPASDSEQKYQQSAISVNNSITQGKWSITVVKVGQFNQSFFGSMTSYIRVDLLVANLGTGADYFQPSHIAIVSPLGQYNVDAFSGTLSTMSSDIYPGYQASGYWLFKGSLTSFDGAKLMFTAGYDEKYNDYQWSFLLK